MKKFSVCMLGLTALLVTPALAADDEKEVAPEFTQAYLDDTANHVKGKELWEDQCRHCHGAKAYPGKAPKLKPRRYKPKFAFDRISNGFRKMPPWKEVYTVEERKALVAYILSRKFSP